MLSALQSLIFKIERPELNIRKPPTRDISVNKFSVKNPERQPEKT